VVVALFALLLWPTVWSGVEGGAPLYDEAAADNGGGVKSLQPFFQSLVARSSCCSSSPVWPMAERPE